MNKKRLTIVDLFVNSPILQYEKDQLIIHANDIPSGIFYIKSGLIKKSALLENGREMTLRVYKEGSLFPLIWAFTDIDNYYYRTVTPVELQKVSRDAFVSFLRGNVDVLFDLTKQILLNDHELFTNIIHQLSGNSYHRVVASLVLYVKRFGADLKEGTRATKISLTHQEIADITGLTRETVTLAMLKLKKKKIITSYNHTLVIKRIDHLVAESSLVNEDIKLFV